MKERRLQDSVSSQIPGNGECILLQFEVLVAVKVHDGIQIGVRAIDGTSAFVLLKVWLLKKSLSYDGGQRWLQDR